MPTAELSRVPSGVMPNPTIPPPPGRGGDLDAWLDRFEAIYRDAAGDVGRIPWAHAQPCPWLITWLNAEAPNLVRAGARAAVVGCGLGQDACALLERGYEVTAFDACASAIDWAKALHPDAADAFFQADLLNLPGRLIGRFDLVVEVHTIQSVPPACWGRLADGMVSLLSHRGVLVAIARGREEGAAGAGSEGPPWPLTKRELTGLMTDRGLAPVRPLDAFTDESANPALRLRGAFKRV
ncbi:MAG TPA: SAM-dependent methyltransferase [Phycisphaerales bacterium]|nr:SAM-dependent methyltransferase [Phycisphaerales bacterium]